MKYYGITNPIHLLGGLLPIYLSIKLTVESPYIDNSIKAGFGGLIFIAFFTSLTILLPMYILSLVKFIIMDNSKVTMIYPFRLRMKEYQIKDIKSVYRQLNNSGRISFMETFIYFGQERRLKFNSFQIINYKGLTDRLETIDPSHSR
jgi:hypothetical protein